MGSMIDINGWKETRDNPLSCVGVFPYLGKDIPGAPDPSAVYYVLRPEEELSDPACIESFKLLPWVDEHTLLGEGYVDAEQKGVHGTIGESVYYKDGYLRGNIKVFSAMLDQLIKSGKKELSCGYRCVYEYSPGVYNGRSYDYIQRKIRGNHLALVEEGRMGPSVCVLDGLDVTFTFTIDSKELQEMAEEDSNTNAGGDEDKGSGEMTLAEAIKVLNSIVPQITKMQEAIANLSKQPDPVDEGTTVADESDEDKKAVAAMDSQIKSLRTELQDMKAGAIKSVMSEVTRRDNLAKALSGHVGVFDHSLMTEVEVAKYGVEKLELTCDSGQEISAIKGFLHNRSTSSNFKTTHAQDSKTKSSGVVAEWANGGSK